MDVYTGLPPGMGGCPGQGLADNTRHVIDTLFEPCFLDLNGIL